MNAFSEEEQKKLIKEALKEWADSKFIIFGKWVFRNLFAYAFLGVLYLAMKAKGII